MSAIPLPLDLARFAKCTLSIAMEASAMVLGDLAQGRNNNLNLIRAIAATAVLVSHAWPIAQGGETPEPLSGLTGRSLGTWAVDVFFVISGYLITASLLSDLDGGRYSLLAFYERRVMRIIPALLFVLSIVAVVGWQLLLPADFESLGQSLWATCLFVSNIAFWQSSGDYFGIHAESQPLLHTWSLSVEEQFYILFPLFLWIIEWESTEVKIHRFILGMSVASSQSR